MKILTSYGIILFSIFQYAHSQVHIDTETINSGNPIYLSGWKYHPGDNPAWAAPDFDDSSWETVDSLLPKDNLPESVWDGIGWFRIKITIDEELAEKPLALLTSQWGASEIYINGEKRFTFGQVSDDPSDEQVYVMLHRSTVTPITPHAQIVNWEDSNSVLISVRYSNHKTNILSTKNGFELGLLNYKEYFKNKEQLNIAISSSFIIGLLISILHISLYVYLPSKKDNLYFACYALIFVFTSYLLPIFTTTNQFLPFFLSKILFNFNAHFEQFLLLYFIYSVFFVKASKLYWLIILYGICSFVLYPNKVFDYLCEFYCVFEVSRVLYTKWHIQKKGLNILRFGVIFYTAFIAVWHACFFFQIPLHHSAWNMAYYILVASASISLALQFTNVFKKIELLNVELEDRVQQRTAELEQANQELRELDKMKSAFVSQASHDLRTPLTGIKGSMDNLMLGIAGTLNEKQTKIVKRALTSMNRLGTLIDDVLDLNRIESGRMTLEKTSFDFCQSVKSIIDEVLPAATQKNITLTTTGLEKPCTITADAGKLERVIGEFIGNAIKYTPENGSVEVSLRLESDSPSPQPSPKGRGSGSHVVFSVKDSGIGLSQEDCTKIFERFYRVDAAKTKAKGSGLGLSIAKELVEMHGGAISVSSELGNGTSFTLSIPSNT